MYLGYIANIATESTIYFECDMCLRWFRDDGVICRMMFCDVVRASRCVNCAVIDSIRPLSVKRFTCFEPARHRWHWLCPGEVINRRFPSDLPSRAACIKG